MVNISECNCGNCTIDNTIKCPFQKWRGMTREENDTSIFFRRDTTKATGCLSHPKAREVLMRDVVVELEKVSKENWDSGNSSDDSWERGFASGTDNAISLIRDGVKKE